MGDWLKNGIMGAAVAETPSVMTAFGWRQNENRDWEQVRTEGSDKLAENLATIGEAASTAPTLSGDIRALYQILRHPVQTVKSATQLLKKRFKPKQVTRNNLRDLLNDPLFLEINEQAMKDARRGIDRAANELRSPSWVETASKHMSPEEAENLGKFESKLLSEIFPPKGQPPLRLRIGEPSKKDALGVTRAVFGQGKVVENRIVIDPFQEDVYSTALHEGQHASTFNFDSTYDYNPFPEELQSALNTQMENAKKLADQLELDPEKIRDLVDYLKSKGHSIEEITNKITKRIQYLKDPQEARARGMSAKIYLEDNPSAIKVPRIIDEGTDFFKDLSNNKLYKDIFSLIPIGGYYGSQD